MPRFAANLTMLFTEHALPRPLRAAPPRPASTPWSSCSPMRFPAQDIKPSAWTPTAGSWCCTTCPPATGTRANAASPATRIGWTSSAPAWPRPSTTPRRWACRSSTAWPATRPAGVPTTRCAKTLVDNLRFAAAELKKAGIRLLIEPINTFDIPGFYLNGTAQALAMLDEVGADNLLLQYDIYHMQRMEGELAATLQRTCRASATSSWPTTPAATNPAPARSTTPSCSAISTAWATRAGSAANTSPPTTTEGPGLDAGARRPALHERQHHHDRAQPIRQPAILKIGFIGLGIMGTPMAGHLIKAGHQLFVHTRSKVPRRWPTAGATPAHHAQGRRRSADIIITHGARHARRGSGAVRRQRRRRRPERRQDRGRHDVHLADRDQGLRPEDRGAGLRLPRRAGVGRRGRREERHAVDHGRRRPRRCSSGSSRCSS